MCFSPANSTLFFFSPGYQHSVVLTGLLPGTTYYYQFGGMASGSGEIYTSAVNYFKSHPGVGASIVTSTIIYGDLGVTLPYDDNPSSSSYYPAEMCMKLISAVVDQPDGATPSPRLAIHIGDISYARGYPVVWEWFLQQISVVSANIAYMVGIGNHVSLLLQSLVSLASQPSLRSSTMLVTVSSGFPRALPTAWTLVVNVE